MLAFGAYARYAEYGWRGVWMLIGIGALIVWVFRFTLPESPRFLATHGRGKEALDVLARLGIAGPKEKLATDAASNTKSDPFARGLSHVPEARHRRHDLLHGVLRRRHRARRMAAEHDDAKGFTHHQVAELYVGMNLAVPCASFFMMYALEKFGRKITSVCAFVGAGIMAIVFANAATDIELLVAGFVMIFFIQVAGNSMQIFASEVFPTNARASGFGWASGVGRLGDRVHHSDDPVGAERLRPDDGVRLPRSRAADRRRHRSPSLVRKPSRQGLDEVAPPTG